MKLKVSCCRYATLGLKGLINSSIVAVLGECRALWGSPDKLTYLGCEARVRWRCAAYKGSWGVGPAM